MQFSSKSNWKSLCILFLDHLPLMTLWLVSSIILALSTALITFITGPLLRVIFGGETLHWSPWIKYFLSAPPDLESIKYALPWLIAGVALLKAFSFFSERVSRGYLVRKIGREIRKQVLEWSFQLSYDEKLSLGQGEIQHRLTKDIERVEVWLELSGASLIRDSINVVFLIICIVITSGYIGLLILTIYPILILPILLFHKKIKLAAKQDISSTHDLYLWGQYCESHLNLAQATQKNSYLEQNLSDYHRDIEKAQARVAILQGTAPSITELSVSLIIACSLLGFIWGLEEQLWSAEELLSLFVGILMLYAPIKSLGRALQQWTNGKLALERCFFSNTKQPKVDNNSESRSYHLSHLSVQLTNILRNDYSIPVQINGTFRKGEIITLAGINGSGKSSILLALANLVPYQGNILFYDDHHLVISREQIQLSWLCNPTKILLEDLIDFYDYYENHGHDLLDLFNFPHHVLPDFKKLLDDSNKNSLQLAIWDWYEALSTGEKQKLNLIIILTRTQNSLILLDEPEAHLDESAKLLLQRELSRLKQQNIIVIATHDQLLIDLSDQTIELFK